MTQEEIQNLKAKLGLNLADKDLSGAGIKLKRVFELLEQAQAEQEFAKREAIKWNDKAIRYKRALEKIMEPYDNGYFEWKRNQTDKDLHEIDWAQEIARKEMEGSEEQDPRTCKCQDVTHDEIGRRSCNDCGMVWFD